MNESVATTESLDRDAGYWGKQIPLADLEVSCRLPVVFLLVKAAGWLLIGSLLACLASLKIHAPGLLAEFSWLTYGKIQPAALNAFVYGFALQASFGCLLWLLVRLGRTELVQPGFIFLGAIFWNLGVFVGIIGILAGDSTSFELLEMPGYSSAILLAAYAIIGGLALLTFHYRTNRELYVSQWFIFAALFWFPWIFSAANLLLIAFPVRGALQSVVTTWYGSGLSFIVLGFVGLAISFYFIPKLFHRPLHSRSLAVLAFWLLILCGGFIGLPAGTPVPTWIAALSSVGAFFVGFAFVAVAVNLFYTCGTVDGRKLGELDDWAKFIVLGTILGIVAGVAIALNAHSKIGQLTAFTFAAPALRHLLLYGFFAMVTFGAAYYLLPRVTQNEWPASPLIKLHLGCSALGVIIYVGALGFGGLQQGSLMNDPNVPFNAVTKPALHFFRLSTFGDLLFLAGSLAFVTNVTWLGCRTYCSGCCSFIEWGRSESEVESEPEVLEVADEKPEPAQSARSARPKKAAVKKAKKAKKATPTKAASRPAPKQAKAKSAAKKAPAKAKRARGNR